MRIIALPCSEPARDDQEVVAPLHDIERLRKYRDRTIEYLPDEFATLRRACRRTGHECPVDGVGPFPDWQTGERGWSEFEHACPAPRPAVASSVSPAGGLLS